MRIKREFWNTIAIPRSFGSISVTRLGRSRYRPSLPAPVRPPFAITRFPAARRPDHHDKFAIRHIRVSGLMTWVLPSQLLVTACNSVLPSYFSLSTRPRTKARCILKQSLLVGSGLTTSPPSPSSFRGAFACGDHPFNPCYGGARSTSVIINNGHKYWFQP